MATIFAVAYAALFIFLNWKISGKPYYTTFLIIAFAAAVLLGCVCLFVFANDAHVDVAKCIFWGICMSILLENDKCRRKKRKENE